MSSNIKRHRRLRNERVALERRHEQERLLLRYPVLFFYRWLEKRAFSRLTSYTPANAGDARQKLVYLMAAIMADRSTVDADKFVTAIDTLRPFRGDLAHCLRKPATPRQ